MQKKEQEKCVMKVSKVISIKEKWENSQEEEKLHPDPNSYHSANTQQDRSSQPPHFQTPNPQKTLLVPKEMKSLKTSLMTKRKPGMERKNSETIENMKTSFLNTKYEDKNEETAKMMGKGEPSPHKVLEYKVRIEHL